MIECQKCGSPYHSVEACPQSKQKKKIGKAGRPKWKTRKQLGLSGDEIPFKFRVDIDPEADDEPEVSRKQALLRLNSQRVYMQMGCASKAYNSMREVAKWVANLFENMDEEDRRSAASVFMGIEGMLAGLEGLSNQKIAQAVRMEEIVEQERKRARLARMRLNRIHSFKTKKANEFGILRSFNPSRVVPLFGDEGLLEQFRFIMEKEKKTPEGEE